MLKDFIKWRRSAFPKWGKIFVNAARSVYNNGMNDFEGGFFPLFPSTVAPSAASVMDATALAFIGDAVQTLAVRTRLSCRENVKTGVLHLKTAKEINATAQSVAAHKILAFLTPEEDAVFKRCRNAHKPTVAKHAAPADYAVSSGLEGLIGFLYLTGRAARMAELMSIAYGTVLSAPKNHNTEPQNKE